ncbi:MAG: hypothetical protein EBR62_03550 [Verrucomicrobia bacterium]|nr:hypothetical protein [Verrucomicrobiota bacterium]
MGFAADIRDLLSTGGFADAPVFGGDLPERPVAAVCVTQTPRQGSQHTFGNTVGAPALEYLGFQIRVRAADYAAADALMEAVHAKLDGLRDKAMDGKQYHWIASSSSPYYLGPDEEQRPIFACNYDVKRSP